MLRAMNEVTGSHMEEWSGSDFERKGCGGRVGGLLGKDIRIDDGDGLALSNRLKSMTCCR